MCVLDIDMQGVRSMKKTNLNPVYIFVKPPSMVELVREINNHHYDVLMLFACRREG